MAVDLNSVLLLIQKYREEDILTSYSHEIASFLSQRGVEAHLVCFGEEEKSETKGDLKVHEFPFKLHGDNYFSWSMLIQTEFVRVIRELLDERKISLLHANDWLTLPASFLASKLFEVPLVVTYHSVEEERGMNKPHSGQISELERQGIQEASYLIVHTESTRGALKTFNLPEGKVKLLKEEDWKEELFKIYEQVVNVSSASERLRAAGEKNENFDAYMGVPSS